MNRGTAGGVVLTKEARIAAHVRAWEQLKRAGPSHAQEELPFITISREFGCQGRPLAQQLTDMLNNRCRPSFPWLAYDRELLDQVASEMRLARQVVDSMDGRRSNEMSELFDAILNRKVDEALVFRRLAGIIRSLAMHGHAVILGRGSYMITQDLKGGLHIRLVAPRDWRIHRVAAERALALAEARRIVEQGERERNRFLSTFFVQNPERPFHHDLVIDNSRFSLGQMAEIIFNALSLRFHEARLAAQGPWAAPPFRQQISSTRCFLFAQRASTNSASPRRFR